MIPGQAVCLAVALELFLGGEYSPRGDSASQVILPEQMPFRTPLDIGFGAGQCSEPEGKCCFLRLKISFFPCQASSRVFKVALTRHTGLFQAPVAIVCLSFPYVLVLPLGHSWVLRLLSRSIRIQASSSSGLLMPSTPC